MSSRVTLFLLCVRQGEQHMVRQLRKDVKIARREAIEVLEFSELG